MKLTVSRLKRLIREELSRVNEYAEMEGNTSGSVEMADQIGQAMEEAITAHGGPMYIDDLVSALAPATRLSPDVIKQEIDTITFDDTKGFSRDGDEISLLQLNNNL